MATADVGLPLRARRKLEARRQILAAAERLIRTRGYALTTMRDVAQEAGLSYQTLYNYFPTKGEIVRTLLGERSEHLTYRYETLLADWAGDLPEALEALNTLSFAVVAEGDRALWRIATIGSLQQSGGAGQVLRLVDERARDLQKRLLMLARNRGELAEDVHLPTLGDVLFDLADHALLRFILDPALAVETALAALGEEMRLVISPHLTTHSRREPT